MKILRTLPCLLLLIGIVFTSFGEVFAQDGERITEFKSDIRVNSDATINVTEQISYVFPTQRRGIEWTYPVTYSVFSFRRPTEFKIRSVSYYPLDNPGSVVVNRYEKTDDLGWVNLRIGDPDVYITGEYVYTIEYDLKYTGISYFEENDEVYLNIIGPGWRVPIQSASATVQLPGEILDSICYTGIEGSINQDCLVSELDDTLVLSTTVSLQPYEAFTFAVKLPKGAIEDTTREQLILSVIANIGILLPIPVGIFLLSYFRRFRNRKLTVIPHYEPEKDMDSFISGLLYKGKYDAKYISAFIIEMAVKGYIKIKAISKKQYEFEYTGKDYSTLPDHERSLLSGMFKSSESVSLKSLKKFYEVTEKVHVEGDQYLKDRDIVSLKKFNTRKSLVSLSIALTIASIFSIPFLLLFAAVAWNIGLLISSILLYIFSFNIDIRSELGNEKYHYLLGLKMYIDTAEKKRIEFHNDPKRYSKVFENLLPYAMIFGLEKKWAREFKDIYTQQPQWYDGSFTTFNAVYLTSSVSNFNRAFAQSTMSPSNYGSSGGFRSSGWSSGGSGFGGGSGGGGGGSGGGSW